MNFDPMTGKPVDNGGTSGGTGFDPMTGEPAGNGAPGGMGFDPMTGQPVGNGAPGGMGFDPMTGQPVGNGGTSGGMGFDPMTGQPVGNGAPGGMGFDPMTGMPVMGKAAKKGGGILKWVIGIAASAAIVGVVAVAGIKSGLFLGKSGKVMLAVNNTIQDTGHLMEDLQFADILNSDKYTVEVSGKVPEGSLEFTYGSTSSAKMASGVLDISGIPDIEFQAMLDSEAFRLSIPSIDDQVYAYYYQDENDGYLMSNMDRNAVEALNGTLEALYSNKDQNELMEDFKDAVADEIKSLEFDKTSSREYEVDGKDRDCKGYVTVITADNIINILDAYEELLADGYGEEWTALMQDSFDEMRYEIDQMYDIELSFYLYKNKLAAVNMYFDSHELEIRFLGGDTRMQNMEIAADGDVVMEIKGSVKDSKEKTRIIVENAEILSIEYNYKSGDFELESMGEMYCSGNIQAGKKEFSLTLDKLRIITEDIDIKGALTVKKGADRLDMSGDEFDIGKASLSDMEELGEHFYGLFGMSRLLY